MVPLHKVWDSFKTWYCEKILLIDFNIITRNYCLNKTTLIFAVAFLLSNSMHVHVQLQINLKCTDAHPQIIWSYMRALSEHQNCWKKRQVTLIKKVLIILKMLLSYGHLHIYIYTWESVPTFATPILPKKTRCWYRFTFLTQIFVKFKLWVSLEYLTGPCRQQFVTTTSWDIHLTYI